jgi:hypothetical protein
MFSDHQAPIKILFSRPRLQEQQIDSSLSNSAEEHNSVHVAALMVVVDELNRLLSLVLPR